jgi:hypothetical protein
VRLVEDPLVFLLREGTRAVVAQFCEQYLREGRRFVAFFFLRRWWRGKDVALFGEVGSGELQAIEKQPCSFVVDCVGDDAAHDLVDTDLDGGCYLFRE